MTVHARDIAAVLRSRLPGVAVNKLHKLLYYCQGHHLARVNEPLFVEAMHAWDMGPVVGQLWLAEREDGPSESSNRLNQVEFNTVGYVLSRYSNLSGQDLQILTRGEPPWRNANLLRGQGQSVRIEREWMREYFTTLGAPCVGDDDDPPIDSVELRRWLAKVDARPLEGKVDTLEEIRARLESGA